MTTALSQRELSVKQLEEKLMRTEEEVEVLQVRVVAVLCVATVLLDVAVAVLTVVDVLVPVELDVLAFGALAGFFLGGTCSYRQGWWLCWLRLLFGSRPGYMFARGYLKRLIYALAGVSVAPLVHVVSRASALGICSLPCICTNCLGTSAPPSIRGSKSAPTEPKTAQRCE